MRESTFLLYKRFILAKSAFIDLMVAKGLVSHKEVAKSPRHTCFLEHLLKLIRERKDRTEHARRYERLLKKLIAMRFRIVEDLMDIVERNIKSIQHHDPSGKYSLLLVRKVEQAVDRATSSDVRFGKNTFRARIHKDIRRIVHKLLKESRDTARFVTCMEMEDGDYLTEESLAQYDGYELVRPATPEELYLIKERLL